MKGIKVGVCLLVVVLGLGVFTAGWSKEKVNLTYWHPYGGKWGEFEKNLVDLWNANYPYIKVKVLSVPGQEIKDKFMTAVMGGSPPNAVFVWSGIDQYMLPKYAIPLNRFFEEDPLMKREDFLSGVLELGTWKGELYGLPMAGCLSGLYYNKKMFREAGLDPETPPKYWSDLEAYAEKLTRKDPKGGYEQVGYTPWESTEGWDMVFFWQNGGRLWDPEAQTVTCDTPKNTETLKWIVNHWAKKYGPEKLSAVIERGPLAGQTGADAFQTGLEAMRYQGVWYGGEAVSYNPELEFGIAPHPYPKDGKPAHYLYGDFLYIPKGAENLAESWKFISWMCLVRPTITVGVAGDASSRKDVFELALVKNNPHYAKMAKWTGYNYVMKDMPKAWFYKKKLTAAIESAVFGKKTPEEALLDLKKTVQAEVDRIFGR